MELHQLTRDLYLFAATLRARLEKDHSLSLAGLLQDAEARFLQMDREAARDPALEVRYHQVRFGLVGLIDEIVVTSTWRYAPEWPLLEQRLYASMIAGDRIYDLIAAFTAADTDLIESFFYILALGFRGKFALDEDRWIQTLEELYRRLPHAPSREIMKLAPEAYRVVKRKAQRLDPLFSLWRSVLVFFVCLIVLFVFYKVAWQNVVNRAQEKAAEVARQVRDPELRRNLEVELR